jgi:two-component system, oxyanion-binding sensor
LTALSLGLNGNAITVSTELYRRIRELDPQAVLQRPLPARVLKRVLDEDRRERRKPLVFAVVFPFSAHNYELRYWLATGGIDPEADVEIRIVPPSSMVERLAGGSIDGYCVGEPWGAYAARLGCGHTIVKSYDIWNNAPEKVLGVTRDWAEHHPRTHRALVRALIDVARWIDCPENHLEMVHIIAGESYVDAPVEVIERAMAVPQALETEKPGASSFYRCAATFPWRSHAIWFVTQMLRWGQIDPPLDITALADAVYRTDIYRDAAAGLGVATPLIDMKSEGAHSAPWLLEAATTPIAMGPDAFLDGREFDPAEPLRYVDSFVAPTPRIRLASVASAERSERD